MRRNDDDAVFFFVKQQTLDAAADFADFWTVLEVVCKSDWAFFATEEEQRVPLLSRLFFERKTAKCDVRDSSGLAVLTDRRETSVRSPDTDSSLFVSSDHSSAVCAEGDVRDLSFVQNFFFSCESLVFVPQRDDSVLPPDRQRRKDWMPCEHSGYLASLDFEVWNHGGFFLHEPIRQQKMQSRRSAKKTSRPWEKILASLETT